MSLVIRPAASRGHFMIDWLNSRHSFSFGEYHDPDHMGFRSLRVINDDIVRAASGFDTHGHRDMEIITYVVRGAIGHRDTTGGEGVLRRGDVQVMSAGTGIRHSEINPSPDEEVRFLQIWVLPERRGFTPEYRQAHFDDAAKHNRLLTLVAPDGAAGALDVHQDVILSAGVLDPDVTVRYELEPGRAAWVQLVDGSVTIGGTRLNAGDGAAITDITAIEITALTGAEILLFDLA